ncbi:hypothetical protein [Halopiger aswanensis]|uniref:Uncharacterized protein n=1 Tax=Halopiger aswanensis TaxID=148449 RepID=A0A3R7EDU5_9EURY|nr:hypothetical protein [Halopiger aswanensis]RKD93791.1 hypothetical protein ATJ93_3423 [Halopiger aswanensis]
MRRRTFVSLAAVVPLAGCSGLLPGGGVDTTLEEGDRAEFSADEGAELTVTVEVQEVFQIEDMDIEREGVSLRIDHADAGLVETRTIAETTTFDLTIANGGTHTVAVAGGVADVTIE